MGRIHHRLGYADGYGPVARRSQQMVELRQQAGKWVGPTEAGKEASTQTNGGWGNNYVKNRYGVSTAANLEDSFLSERVAQQARMFGLGGDDGDFQPVAIDTELKDGDTISIGESNLQVLAVPGHSPGSIALYDPIGGFVIVGDALFRGAIGRTDLPGGAYRTLSASIRNKLFALPDKTIVYPGHEATTTIGIEKKTNPYV